jgi:D-3-phosphoglycerate dehydrogenase
MGRFGAGWTERSGYTSDEQPRMKAVVLVSLHPQVRTLLEETVQVAYGGWALSDPVVTALPGDAEILKLARDAHAIIVPGELSRAVIEGCPELRVIGVARGDPRGVDLVAATARGIPVVFAAGRNAKAVAEVTLGFVVMLLRQLVPAHNFVGEGRWRTWDDLFATTLVAGTEMNQRTLGLVGFGFVGQEVTRRALAFDLRVLVYDPYLPAQTIYDQGAVSVDLDELMSGSDIVSIHCKVTDETRCMIGRREIGLMKPGSYFINTARASIVDEAALLDGLMTGQLAGVALDVYWSEPLSADSPWLKLPNVIHTPHIGGATTDLEMRTSAMVVQDILAVLRGDRPRFIANPTVLEGKPR